MLFSGEQLLIRISFTAVDLTLGASLRLGLCSAGTREEHHVHRRSAIEDLPSHAQKALRHYEEIGLLRPAHVDRFNQYRYYSTDQVELVRLIRIARDTGMSLARIKGSTRARDRVESRGAF